MINDNYYLKAPPHAADSGTNQFFVFSGFCETSFSAVSANFLTSSSSFFSAFHALSDGSNPEMEILQKKNHKNQVFSENLGFFHENFRNF